MARRQYARNTYTRRNAAAPSLAGVWLLLGIFLGVGIMGLAYLFYSPVNPMNFRMMSSPPFHTSDASNRRMGHERAQVNRKNHKAKETETRFEFYTMLPDMEVELPKSVAAQGENSPANKSQSTKSTPGIQTTETHSPTLAIAPAAPLPSSSKLGQQYILQAGNFQAITEADTLKAKLALQGFTPQIQKVQNQNGQTWFRVTLGPYASESQALNQKKRLEDQKIQSTLILQKPSNRK